MKKSGTDIRGRQSVDAQAELQALVVASGLKVHL